MADNDETLDPVTIGDLILLNATEPKEYVGGLRGDTASFTTGIQLPNFSQKRDELQFDDYVFRVCPALNYRQRNELDIHEMKTSGISSSKSSSGKSDGPKTLQRKMSTRDQEANAAALSLLHKRVEVEAAQNAAVLELVQQGTYTVITPTGPVKPQVRYGDTVMLQHVKSGCFVAAFESAAPCDPECRAIKLVEKDSASTLFRLGPRFKAQTEGSIVYYSHTLVVESVKQRGMLLHTSPIAYTDVPDPENPTFPKCLQTGKTMEINLSPQSTAFAVTKYGRFSTEDVGLLRTGDPFRLYHSQTESFMHASCDAEKDRRYPNGRNDNFPTHVPYLKKLPDLGDTPDPTDPQHHFPKGVWGFEATRRRTTTTVAWESIYRIRHLPSGRYLAIDSTVPIREETEGLVESWFGTCLVDDAALPGEEVAMFDEAGNHLGFKAVPPSWLEVIASSADVAHSNCVQKADVNLRLSHVFKDSNTGAKTTVYLHCTDERKPTKVGSDPSKRSIIASSLGLVFSTVKLAQDIFKMLPVTTEEQIAIETATAFRAPLAAYNEAMNNKEVKITTEMVLDVIKALFTVIDLQVQGDYYFPPGKDWVAEANSKLPAAFSALFNGEADPPVQRIARDVKLMDIVFAIGSAPYNRFAPESPWGTEEMEGPRAVQKFVHVALQRMCANNAESYKYFGKRAYKPLLAPGSTAEVKPISWMSTLLDQLEDPLGSAVTLSKMLSQSDDLMRTYAAPSLVSRFLDMIRNLGPQPRLVNFFEAICTVGGIAVKANQEMVLRLTWMNVEWRGKVYLETKDFDPTKFPCNPQLPKFPDVKEPSGALTSGWRPNKEAAKAMPPKYIGKEEHERDGSFSPVFVRWGSADAWKKNMDALFWSPVYLNITTYTVDKEPWVRLEDLCWVLEPERLCMAFTGKPWSEFNRAAAKNATAGARLKAHTQLANYYVGQLSLLGKLCFGRSYNCIDWMQRSFSYTMLCSMAYSPHLPAKVRSVSTTFLRCLYLDRYPQVKNLGRPTLPEQLWVNELKDKDLPAKNSLPLIKPRVLSDADALPVFDLSKSHKFYGHEDPILGFPGHTKFFLLRNLGNRYLKSFGTGAVVHQVVNENELANCVVAMIAGLTTFGFQSTHQKIKDLLAGLVAVLDGRSDVESFSDGQFLPFSPASARFLVSPASTEVTALKSNIINILLDVANLRANFRLGKLLQRFKEYAADPKLSLEMKKLNAYIENDKADMFEGTITDKIFNDFEELFISGDGAALDLKKLSGGQEVDLILVDCLMYEDDKLFAKALSLLERTYAQRRKLLNALGDIVLLEDEKVAVFGNAADMSSDISYLTFLVRSSEVWGVFSRVSGPFGPEKYQLVIETCRRLEEFLTPVEDTDKSKGGSSEKGERAVRPQSPRTASALGLFSPGKAAASSRQFAPMIMSVQYYQDILRSMDIQTTLIESLRMDYNISFKGSICTSEQKIESREMLVHSQRSLIQVLVNFVRGNKKNQAIVIKHLEALRKHLGPLKLPHVWPADFSDDHKKKLATEPGMDTESVIIECLRNNAQLCHGSVPRDLLEEFGGYMDKQKDPTNCGQMEVFGIVCLPSGRNDKAIPRNQDMVLDILLSDSLPNIWATISAIFFGSGIGGAAGSMPEKLVDLFSATICQGNIRAASKLQSKKITIETTLEVLSKLLNGRIKAGDDADSALGSRLGVVTSVLQIPLFGALLEFLSLQLEVLVVDPKLFRMEKTWQLITDGVKMVLADAVVAIESMSMSTNQVQSLLSACKCASVFIDGARTLGLKEAEGDKNGPLMTDDDAVYKSAKEIATSSTTATNTWKIREATAALCHVLDPSRVVLRSEDAEITIGGEEDVDVDEDGVEMSSPPARKATMNRNISFSETYGNMSSIVSAAMAETELDVSKADTPRTLPEMANFFRLALEENPKLKRKLRSRQFEFVNILENASLNTGETGANNKVGGCDGMGATEITWPMLVGRMVKYVEAHNHDKDETTCLSVMKVLRSHLVRARSAEDGTLGDMWDLPEDRLAAYIEKQTSFVELGVASIALRAIATHPASVEGNLADAGVEMLLEMGNGGNPALQVKVEDHITNHDRDNKFLQHLRTRMLTSLEVIRVRKEITSSGYVVMTASTRTEYANAVETLELIQKLCEGHNVECQNILREQPTHSASVNLVELAAVTLGVLCDTTHSLKEMEDCEIKLAIALLEFLTETLQGPCPRNQELLSSLDDFIAGVDKLMQSGFDPRIDPALRLGAKASSVKLLASLLEGRVDKVVHHALAERVEPVLFELFRGWVTTMMSKSREQKNLSPEEYETQETIALDAMSSVSTILKEMRNEKVFMDKMVVVDKKKKKLTSDLMDQQVRVVEVLWNDRIECTSFPLPKDAEFLTEKSKNEFLLGADISTSDKRMKDLIEAAPIFMAEMEQIYAMTKRSALYTFIHHNITSIKYVMYALVVLLNLNIVMASYGADSDEGYVSIADGFFYGNVEPEYRISLLISLVLALINLAGYIVIVSFLAITEVPIIIKQNDDYVQDCLDDMNMKEEAYRDAGAFTWWFVTLVFNVVFIVQHLANYPKNPNYDLYLFLVVGINLPWTMSCVRNYIVVPNTWQTRIFCVGYDVVVTKPFFRNHLLLMVCSINGFIASYYFPLMLLDIVNNSSVIANIARSVSGSLVELGWVFYVFVITIIIYAQFGLENFEDFFQYDEDDDEAVRCHSVVSCAMLIFYKGVPDGSLAGIMASVDNREQPVYQQRMLFDLSFFIWVGMILFNIITGLLVDGFGALREEDNDRRDILENSCFVCGFTRTAFDDIPNFRGPNFDHHRDEEHAFWSYVHYYVYLKRKDKTEYNGVDSYVWSMLMDNNLGWIPVRNSAAIQEANVVIEESGGMSPHDLVLKARLQKFSHDLESSIQTQNKKSFVNLKTLKETSRKVQSEMAMFLEQYTLESFAGALISRGFPDPISLADLSGLDDNTLAQEIGMNETEIRRLKAASNLAPFFNKTLRKKASRISIQDPTSNTPQLPPTESRAPTASSAASSSSPGEQRKPSPSRKKVETKESSLSTSSSRKSPMKSTLRPMISNKVQRSSKLETKLGATTPSSAVVGSGSKKTSDNTGTPRMTPKRSTSTSRNSSFSTPTSTPNSKKRSSSLNEKSKTTK